MNGYKPHRTHPTDRLKEKLKNHWSEGALKCQISGQLYSYSGDSVVESPPNKWEEIFLKCQLEFFSSLRTASSDLWIPVLKSVEVLVGIEHPYNFTMIWWLKCLKWLRKFCPKCMTFILNSNLVTENHLSVMVIIMKHEYVIYKRPHIYL